MASVHFWRVRLGRSETLARQISQSYSFLWHGRILSRMCCRWVMNRRLFSHGWHGFRFPRKLLKRLKFYTSWYQSFASGLKVKETTEGKPICACTEISLSHWNCMFYQGWMQVFCKFGLHDFTQKASRKQEKGKEQTQNTLIYNKEKTDKAN